MLLIHNLTKNTFEAVWQCILALKLEFTITNRNCGKKWPQSSQYAGGHTTLEALTRKRGL